MRLIGEVLQSKRERLGMTLAELESRTHIQRETLIAIENNQFETLNQPTYVIGFIRKYAQAVNMDSVQLLEKHREELPKTHRFASEALKQLSNGEKSAQFQNRDKETKQVAMIIASLIGVTAVFWAVFGLVL